MWSLNGVCYQQKRLVIVIYCPVCGSAAYGEVSRFHTDCSTEWVKATYSLSFPSSI